MREVRKRFILKYKSVRHLRGFEGVRLRKAEMQWVIQRSIILTSIQLLVMLYNVEMKNVYVGDLL